jgi:glycosyltransferase involved in cell wall biosynthesis
VRALFVDQGRAMADAAMGHVRVRHALRAGLEAVEGALEIDELEVPPFTRWKNRLVRYVPRLEGGGFGSVRWHLARSWVARREIAERLDRRPADVVHVTTDQVSLLLGRLHDRVPIVLSLDILAVDWARLKRYVYPGTETPGYLKPLARLERRALERTPLSIAWTETVAETIGRLAPGARVEVLHPGLDLRVHRPAPDRNGSGPTRVLFVGGRWEQKGGPQLVEALRPMLGRTVHLDVVTTENVAPVDGMSVHSGAPGSSEVAELFANADLFCLPTLVDACPWVALEAMASGVPVVSTTVGSIPELVGDGGLLIDPGDDAALAEALGALLDDRERRATMGAAGRARVEERYDARVNTPRLIEMLREVAR